ncbi:hypothetical protein ACFQ0B_74045 [Nonomuraea thailandensis]
MTHLPYGKTASGPWSVEITPSVAGWTYSGLRIADLTNAPLTFDTGEEEMLVLPSQAPARSRSPARRSCWQAGPRSSTAPPISPISRFLRM